MQSHLFKKGRIIYLKNIKETKEQVVCFAALWDKILKTQAKKSHTFPCIPILTIFNHKKAS